MYAQVPMLVYEGNMREQLQVNGRCSKKILTVMTCVSHTEILTGLFVSISKCIVGLPSAITALFCAF